MLRVYVSTFFGVALDFDRLSPGLWRGCVLSPKGLSVAGARGIVFEVDGVAILVEQFFPCVLTGCSARDDVSVGGSGCVILLPFLKLRAYNPCICTWPIMTNYSVYRPKCRTVRVNS